MIEFIDKRFLGVLIALLVIGIASYIGTIFISPWFSLLLTASVMAMVFAIAIKLAVTYFKVQ